MGENEVNEAVAEVDGAAIDNEELKEAINKQLEKIRNDAIIVGYRVACKMVIDMITPWHQPNCSHREYERIFKKLEEFCSKALKQDEKKETSENADVTVQNEWRLANGSNTKTSYGKASIGY